MKKCFAYIHTLFGDILMSRKGNSAYVVWGDVTPGNAEILFKKGQ